MKLLHLFKSLKNAETGVATVDWGALTTAVVGLGMIMIISLGGGITQLASKLQDDVGARSSC